MCLKEFTIRFLSNRLWITFLNMSLYNIVIYETILNHIHMSGNNPKNVCNSAEL